jgi:hypothetical protein
MPKRPNLIPTVFLSLLLIAGAGVLIAQDGDNLDYWLDQSEVTDGNIAIEAPTESPADRIPDAALPVVLEEMDGSPVTGWAYRDADRAITVYETASERYRRIPLAACLSIRSTLDAQMENEWRWSETGSNEKIYTGNQYPVAEVSWTFLIADGTEIEGTVKGQTIRFVTDEGDVRRLLLSSKLRGEVGQTVDDLDCFARLVISRRVREDLLDADKTESDADSGDSED